MQSALFLELGKRTGQSLMATSAPGQPRSRLFFVRESLSHRHFLVYTGADISVIPPVQSDRQHPQCGVNLQAANGASIATFGQRSLTLNLGLRRPYLWIFTFADVSSPHTWNSFPGTPWSIG